MPHSSLALANEFLARAFDRQAALTHMQLQKLVYMSHGFSLGSGNGPLVEEFFEAWAFGPVVRKLYDALKHYGPRKVSSLIKWGDDTRLINEGRFEIAFEQINQFERELIDWVAAQYSNYHAFQLSALTHEKGSPWEGSFKDGQNRIIDNGEIEKYFRTLVHDARAYAD